MVIGHQVYRTIGDLIDNCRTRFNQAVTWFMQGEFEFW
jgi:hypothetical protein